MLIRRLGLALAFAASVLHPRAAAAQAAAPSPAAEVGLRVGDTVPAFHAVGLDGVTKSIDYPKGTTTLVVFFLSGCPTCHKMLPLWNEAYARRPRNM
ncbi:MAG TPA: thioredoxin family protein, partial [Vicinamibacteria bacterium]|nr:thioredoxin family protein [Vicinamibacteria bacterium]